MNFHVLSHLEHDGDDYPKGSVIDLSEDSAAAQSLLEAGVLSDTPPQVEVVDAPAPAEEAIVQPNVGGQQNQSGEPSLDGQPEAAPSSEAQDVTPVVSEKMTRAELEVSARANGVAEDAIARARTKAALVDLIAAPKVTTEATSEQEPVDPSANL